MSAVLSEWHLLNAAILTVSHSLHKAVWLTLFSPAPHLHRQACVDFGRSDAEKGSRGQSATVEMEVVCLIMLH